MSGYYRFPTINNSSGYTQPFIYSMSDEFGLFDEVIDTLTIGGYQNTTITLESVNQQDSVSSLSLEIWPQYHEYALKLLSFDIFRVSGVLASDEKATPMGYKLFKNYPNPFNASTTLHYALPDGSVINIIIYDINGRVVRRMINNYQTAGYKTISWNATNDEGKPVSAGVYFYSIQAGGFMQTKKMVLLK